MCACMCAALREELAELEAEADELGLQGSQRLRRLHALQIAAALRQSSHRRGALMNRLPPSARLLSKQQQQQQQQEALPQGQPPLQPERAQPPLPKDSKQAFTLSHEAPSGLLPPLQAQGGQHQGAAPAHEGLLRGGAKRSLDFHAAHTGPQPPAVVGGTSKGQAAQGNALAGHAGAQAAAAAPGQQHPLPAGVGGRPSDFMATEPHKGQAGTSQQQQQQRQQVPGPAAGLASQAERAVGLGATNISDAWLR